MPSRRVVRRCIGAGAVCVLGLATAVGVAWVLSLVQDLNGATAGGPVSHHYRAQHFEPGHGPGRLLDDGSGRSVGDVRYIEILRFHRPGGVFFESCAAGSRSEGSGVRERTFDPDLWGPETFCDPIRPVVLPWIDGHASWPGPDDNDFRFAEARGWPFPCVWCEFTMETDAAFRISAAAHGGVEIPSIRQNKGLLSGTYPAVLPWRPLWAGLLTDAVFYSVLWTCPLLAFIAIAALRRASRAARGQCPGCGYPLSGVNAAKCPECGLETGAAVRPERDTSVA